MQLVSSRLNLIAPQTSPSRMGVAAPLLLDPSEDYYLYSDGYGLVPGLKLDANEMQQSSAQSGQGHPAS